MPVAELRDLLIDDVNSDGLPDVIVADATNRLRVAINEGMPGFADPVSFTFRNMSVAGTTSMVSRDTNRDGYPDLLLATSRGENSTDLFWLRNQGQDDDQWLGWAEPTLVAEYPGSLQFVLEDLDADGVVDLATSASNAVTVYRGVGDGTFSSPIRYLEGAGTRTLSAHDFDRDGALDLAVADARAGRVIILRGSGDGTFEAMDQRYSLSPPGSVGPQGAGRWQLTAGDVDADGDLDLVIAQNYSHGDNLAILLGNGDGTFDPEPIRDMVPGTPNRIIAGDIDQDGDVDLVVDHSGALHHPIYDNVGGALSILLGDGTPYFDAPLRVREQDNSSTVQLADLNGDGRSDLVTIVGASASYLLGATDKAFAEGYTAYAAGYGANQVASGDLDADGDLDLVVTNRYSQDISVLLGNGDATFAQDQDSVAMKAWPTRQVGADLNGDGRLDLVTLNSSTGDISVLLRSGQGFDDEVRYPVGQWPQQLLTSDLNADGNPDVVVASGGAANEIHVLLNPGNGSLLPIQHYITPTSVGSIAVDDYSGDGNLDLLIAGEGGVYGVEGQGDGSFGSRQLLARGEYFHSLSVVDLNGDQLKDIVAAHNRQGLSEALVLLKEGPGVYAEPIRRRLSSSGGQILVADLAGDGIADLIESTWNGLNVYAGQGDGTFGQATRYRMSDGYSGMIAQDLNADGFVDIVSTGQVGVSIHLGLGDGTLAEAVQYAVGHGPTSPVAADVDDDGDLDLALVNYGTATITLLLANGDGTFQSDNRYPVGQDPTSLFVVDIEQDGTLDVIVGSGSSARTIVFSGNGDGTLQAATSHAVGRIPNAMAVETFGPEDEMFVVTAQFDRWEVSVSGGLREGEFLHEELVRMLTGIQRLFYEDINHDSIPDLIAVTQTGGGSVIIGVRLGDSEGAYGDLIRSTVGGGYVTSALIHDFTQDGTPDVAISTANPNQIVFLSGNGQGQFDRVTTHAMTTTLTDLALTDINLDGHLDVIGAFGNQYGCYRLCTSGFAVMYGQGDGSLKDAVNHFIPANGFTSLLANDLDSDGDADLVMVNQMGAHVVLNQTRQRLPRLAGDVNGDGRFDSVDLIAVLSAGEYEDDIIGNSTFEEGDWDGDGEFTSRDLVLAFQFGEYQR